MSTKLVPNQQGLVEIRVDAEDARKGYIMVEDWDGKEHKIMVRSNEGDVIALPVPKIRYAGTERPEKHKTQTKA